MYTFGICIPQTASILNSLLGHGPRLEFEPFKQRQVPASLATRADGNLTQQRYCICQNYFNYARAVLFQTIVAQGHLAHLAEENWVLHAS